VIDDALSVSTGDRLGVAAAHATAAVPIASQEIRSMKWAPWGSNPQPAD
jgi:hypothetical protein